jgi:arylformamidase
MRRDDPAWLDGQYNNRARDRPTMRTSSRRGPGPPPTRGSTHPARARPALRRRCGRDAGPVSGRVSRARCRRPGAGVHPRRLLAVAGQVRPFLRRAVLAADGALVVVPNYALCPAVGIEHITLQMVKALAWVWRHAAAYGGDPSRIVVAGHSAGAHLAAMLLSCRWKRGGRRPAGAAGAVARCDLRRVRPRAAAPDDRSCSPTWAHAGVGARLSPAFFPRPKGRCLRWWGATRATSSCARTS